MAAIKKLAGQTLWYGGSNIGAKFLNYLLTPLLTNLMHDVHGVRDYGDYSLLYAWIGVLNIVFTYGFETGYFRFSNQEGVDRSRLFDTTFGSLLVSSLLLIVAFSFFAGPIYGFLDFDGKPTYVIWCLLLIGLDAIAAIPFARLRQEGRPKKYAFVKLGGIVVNIICTVLFLVVLPRFFSGRPESAFSQWYYSNSRVGYLILANVIQNVFVFAVLFAEWRDFRWRIDKKLWKKVFHFSSPMIVIGLAGMVNEVMDRQMLAKFLPMGTDAKRIVGIYSANYKLAIFITLFIQAFKMAAEPFFFGEAGRKDAKATYAKVLKWFVITLCIAFLFSALYLDVWKHLINVSYRSGLGIVPVLLFANICLGIYYNLSVWYKLTDKMWFGFYITLFGALITVAGNYFFIPYFGMYASAWSTLTCYAVMVVATYILGQRYYPVNYPVKKVFSYLSAMLLLFFLKRAVDALTLGLAAPSQLLVRFATATLLMLLFVVLVIAVERSELKSLPVIGKYIK